MGKGAEPGTAEAGNCSPGGKQHSALEKLGIERDPLTGISDGFTPHQAYRGQARRAKRLCVVASTLNILLFIIAVICLAVACAGSKKNMCNERSGPSSAVCEDGWLWYSGKCYFFSQNDTEWEMAQQFCESHGASLAIIDSTQEWDFLMRFKGSPDRWIGLKRNPEQQWEWTDHRKFGDLFVITGESDCAYLNHDGTNSARCYGDRKWICNRRVSAETGNPQSNL